jgi:hypothetical protein
MLRTRLRFGAGAAIVVMALALCGSPVAATTPRVPTQRADCFNNGWRSLVDGEGQAFRNQGQCVSWVNAHPHVFSLSDLTGTFAGTSVFEFQEAGCVFVHQVLDATYPGSSAVGDVTLHIDTCVNFPSMGGFITMFPQTGTFTITTTVGGLSGTVAGTQTVLVTPVPINLTLTPTAGTGVLASLLSGVLQVNGNWFSNGTAGAMVPFDGAVTT